jgi:ElaB/YqjD/DUF883 family membrane-anchored ribosome-binding protein
MMGQNHDDAVRTLIRDVDEFLGYIAIVKTPEVDQVREGLELSLAMARRELVDAAMQSGRSGQVGSLGLIDLRPWIAVGAAAVIGALLGSWARLRRRDAQRAYQRAYH